MIDFCSFLLCSSDLPVFQRFLTHQGSSITIFYFMTFQYQPHKQVILIVIVTEIFNLILVLPFCHSVVLPHPVSWHTFSYIYVGQPKSIMPPTSSNQKWCMESHPILELLIRLKAFIPTVKNGTWRDNWILNSTVLMWWNNFIQQSRMEYVELMSFRTVLIGRMLWRATHFKNSTD